MSDLIDRQAAIERFDYIRPRDPMTSDYTHGIDVGIALCKVAIREQPPAQLGTNLAEVGTEERAEERTETHACDYISRQQAIDEIDEWIKAFRENGHKESAADACLIQDGIIQLPPAQLSTDLISRQAAITQLSHNKNKGDDEWELAVENDIQTIWKLPPAQPHTYRGVTLNDVMMYFDSLDGNEDAWTEFCSCFECRGWGLYHIRSATDKNVGTNDDCISRQAAIDALKNDMASLDHIIQGMSGYDVRLDAYVSQRNQVDCDIDTINNLPTAQPEELDTLIKALEAEHKKLREMQEAQSGPHWIPVTVINQNYIPELKDFPYGGVLFTYRTPKGKLLVREAWVERGRIIGKKMNGTPIAYQQKPEPWEGDAE